MSRRFFVEGPVEHGKIDLPRAEAHHLSRVLRLAEGDTVVIFDGSGREWPGRIAQLGRDRATIDLAAAREEDREAVVQLTLAVALPKGERQRWLVEKATELGVARLIPLVSRRSVAQPRPATLDKLRRTVIEASKQCGRNRLLEIAEPQHFGCLVDDFNDQHRLLLHPRGAPAQESYTGEPNDASPIIAIVGPEGGLSDEELHEAGQRGWQAIWLGPRTLRVETAALAIAARLL